MFEKLEILQMSAGMAAHAGERQALVAQNLAHADTPNFRARDLPSFADIYQSNSDFALRRTRADHMDQMPPAGLAPMARDDGGQAAPNGNTVSLENEMLRAVEIRRSHDRALAIYRNSLDLMRAALGRGR